MERERIRVISSHGLKSPKPYDYSDCIANTTHNQFDFSVPGEQELVEFIISNEELYRLLKQHRDGNPCLFCG